MTELDARTFAQGVRDSIRAARNIYGAVRQVREEIRVVLEQSPAPLLYDLRIRAEASNYRHPEEKILHSWEGRFYSDNPALAGGEPEDDDDDAEGEPEEEEAPKGRGPLVLAAGQRLAYIKIVLYQPNVAAPEPHVLYGVLHDCRVARGWQEIEVRRYMLRRILYVIDESLAPGDLRPHIRVQAPKGVPKPKGKDMTNRLMFTVHQPPERVALYDVRGPEQVRGIADRLKRFWTA